MIRKGIPGIRKIRETNNTGWHVLVTGAGITDKDAYREYSTEHFADLVTKYGAEGADLIGVTGNGLHFTIDMQNA